jgi:type IV pilus assembly protein PilV
MSRQRGVTIVEGLVALVILSVGMLGIASLYVTSLKTGRTALLRTQAVNLVNGIIDSIRANGTAGVAYELDTLAEAPTADPEAPAICGADGVCTAAEIADQDLMNWAAALNAALPGPEASIAYTDSAAGVPDIYTVSVSWQESGETQRFQYQGSLEMLPVMP